MFDVSIRPAWSSAQLRGSDTARQCGGVRVPHRPHGLYALSVRPRAPDGFVCARTGPDGRFEFQRSARAPIRRATRRRTSTSRPTRLMAGSTAARWNSAMTLIGAGDRARANASGEFGTIRKVRHEGNVQHVRVGLTRSTMQNRLGPGVRPPSASAKIRAWCPEIPVRRRPEGVF